MLPESGQPIFDLTTNEQVGTVAEVDDLTFGMEPLPGKAITDAYVVLRNGEHVNILAHLQSSSAGQPRPCTAQWRASHYASEPFSRCSLRQEKPAVR